MGVSRDLPKVVESELRRMCELRGWLVQLARIGDVVELSSNVVALARLGLASTDVNASHISDAASRNHASEVESGYKNAASTTRRRCDLHLWIWTEVPRAEDPEVARALAASLLRSRGVHYATTVYIIAPDGITSMNGRRLKQALAQDRVQTLGMRNSNAPTESRLLAAIKYLYNSSAAMCCEGGQVNVE